MRTWPILCLSLLPREAASDSDDWIARTFGPTFEERFGRAFESAWRATFGEEADPSLREALEPAFRKAFERALRETFDADSIDEETDDEGDEGLWGRRRLLSSTYDPNRIRWEEEFAYDDPAERIERIDLRTVNGKITVRGEATDRIRLHVTRVVRATDEAKGEAFRRAFRPFLHRLEGRTLFVETPSKEQIDWPRAIEEARMDYDVVVPASFAVRAVAVNGRVEAENVLRDADLRTVNGAVALRSDEGIDGAVRLESVNGKLTLELGFLSEGARLKTVNGAITAIVRESFAGGFDAKCVNGAITLGLPDDASFHLRAKTGHGRIQTDWGKPPRSGRFLPDFGREFEAEVNGGGDPVRLETSHGAIDVHAVD